MVDELALLDVGSQLAHHAGTLAETEKLRGYDAVHLASAMSLGADTTIVTWDIELGRAAQHVGLGVAPAPGSAPGAG